MRTQRTISELEDDRAEAERLKQLLEEQTRHAEELQEELDRQAERVELKQLQAVAEEKTKWEAREDRLMAVLEQVQSQLGALTADPATVTTDSDVTPLLLYLPQLQNILLKPPLPWGG